MSYNMFAYCLNNPVNGKDSTGTNPEWAQRWITTMWWLYGADSLLPVGDLIYLGGALLFSATALILYSNTTVSVPSITICEPKEEDETKEEEKTVTESSSSSTPIYRYGGTNPGNLIPSKNDVSTGTGLSFSTIPKPGATMTTIEVVNATGVLRAVRDGATHVSVYPVGTTIAGWRNAGTGSIWTVTLKSIVIKWTP